MAEELLDLAQVRTGTQELGGEDMSERVRRDPFALRYAGCACIAEKRLRQDRLREAAALHADKESRLRVVRPHAQVIDEERLESWVDRQDALAAALRPPHLQ